MTNTFLVQFINLLFTGLSLAIFGQVIMSWISPQGDDPLSNFLNQITEPILKPIRSVVPPLGMFDLTPMIALLVLNFARPFIVRMLSGI